MNTDMVNMMAETDAFDFVVHTKGGCTYCEQAKALLKQKGHTYREVFYATDAEFDAFIAAGYRSFPQIYDGDIHIGGFAELRRYLI